MVQNVLNLVQEKLLEEEEYNKQVANLGNQSYRINRHKGLIDIH